MAIQNNPNVNLGDPLVEKASENRSDNKVGTSAHYRSSADLLSGLIVTLSWAFAIWFGQRLSQSFAISYLMHRQKFVQINHGTMSLNKSGFSLMILTGSFFTIVLSILAVSLRRGIPIKECFALNLPPKEVQGKWIGAFAVFATLTEYILHFYVPIATLHPVREIAQEGVIGITLFFLTSVVVAPISEEFFFRGYLLAGLKDSIVGKSGAVIITSILFVLFHGTRGSHEQIWIAAAGFFLAVTRLETKSLPLCIFLHGSSNLVLLLIHY